MYCVLTVSGDLKTLRRRRVACLYDTKSKAVNQARADGDTVVEATIDMDREPLFIRRKVLDGD